MLQKEEKEVLEMSGSLTKQVIEIEKPRGCPEKAIKAAVANMKKAGWSDEGILGMARQNLIFGGNKKKTQ